MRCPDLSCSWTCFSLSGILVATFALACLRAVGLGLHISGTVAIRDALSRPLLGQTHTERPVLRMNISAALRIAEALGGDGDGRVVIIEGGAGAGKSSAVAAAATNLSMRGVRVLSHTARPGQSEEDVLRGLFGLGAAHSLGDALGDVVLGTVKDVGPQLRALWRLALGAHAELRTAVYGALCEQAGCGVDSAGQPWGGLPRASSHPASDGKALAAPPVFVVEAAHALPAAALLSLLSFARLCTEHGLARWAFVVGGGGLQIAGEGGGRKRKGGRDDASAHSLHPSPPQACSAAPRRCTPQMRSQASTSWVWTAWPPPTQRPS